MSAMTPSLASLTRPPKAPPSNQTAQEPALLFPSLRRSRRRRKSKVSKQSTTDEPTSPEQRPHVVSNQEDDLSLHTVGEDGSFSVDWNKAETGLGNYMESSSEAASAAPKFGFFRKKVASVDVASVGNASDTLVALTSSSHTISGRELHEKAKVHFNECDYEGALPLFQAILEAQTVRFTDWHPSVGAALHNVGVCRQRLQDHQAAVGLFEKAVEIRQGTMGEDHLEVAASLSKWGASLTSLQRLDEAFEKLRLALQIAKWNLGRSHKTVAQMLCHLGCFYFEAGELFSAQATFQDALEIYRTVWRTCDDRDACMAQLTDTLCNIGSIQNRRKAYASAVESFSEALDLQRGIVGHDDTRVLSALDNLGYSYSKQRDYVSAIESYRKMLHAQMSHDGNVFSWACLETLQKLVVIYQKKDKRATPALEEVEHWRAALGPDHPMADALQSLAAELRAKQRKQGSRPCAI